MDYPIAFAGLLGVMWYFDMLHWPTKVKPPQGDSVVAYSGDIQRYRDQHSPFTPW